MIPKFKSGDKVISSISPDIVQPMTVVAIDRDFNSSKMQSGELPYIYIVSGVHAKKGNVLTCRLEENWLNIVEDS